MGQISIKYALPASRLHIDSVVTISEDSVLTADPAPSPQSTVMLEVGGDRRTHTLSVSAGAFFNTNVSLELTEDGRLKSTEFDLAGQAGKVVLGVVGAATSIAAAVVAPPVAPVALNSLLSRAQYATAPQGHD